MKSDCLKRCKEGDIIVYRYRVYIESEEIYFEVCNIFDGQYVKAKRMDGKGGKSCFDPRYMMNIVRIIRK